MESSDTLTRVKPAEESVLLDAVAAHELAEFIASSEEASKSDTPISLRVTIVGGGCAGFQYRLGLDAVKEDDLVFESEGQKVIVDPVSFPFIVGSTITYRSDIDRQGFEVLNPRAQAACGCGSSFNVAN